MSATIPVSIVMPCRNEQGNVRRAVRGYLAQNVSWVHVINDASTDGTWEEATSAGVGCSVISTEGVGVVQCCNIGLARVSTPWVAFVSANDGVLDVDTLYRATRPLDIDSCPTYVAGRVRFVDGRKTWLSTDPHGAGVLWNKDFLVDSCGFRTDIDDCLADRHKLLELAFGGVRIPDVVQTFYVNRKSRYWQLRESGELDRIARTYFCHDPEFGWRRTALRRVKDALPWWLFNPIAAVVGGLQRGRWR